MIKLGSKELGMSGWRNQNILNDETLKNIYGQKAVQNFSDKN